MAFFKSFQQNLPSVNISSILDSVSSRVDDLASAVSDATYTVSDQFSEQVNTMIHKVQTEEEEGAGEDGEGRPQAGRRQASGGAESTDHGSRNCDPNAEVGGSNSQLEWEWRDGGWRVKRTEAELAEEERKKEEREKEKAEKEKEREKRRKKKEEARLRKNQEHEDGHKEDEKPKGGEDESASVTNSQSKQDGEKAGGGDKPQPTDQHGKPVPSTSPQTKPNDLKDKKKKGNAKGEVDDEAGPEKEQRPEAKEKQEGEVEEKEGKEPPTLPAQTKEDQSLKKNGKNGEKPAKEKKKDKDVAKSKKKKKGDKEGASSDSEEERPGRESEATAQQNTASVWDNRPKHKSTELDGYSSEGSTGTATIQRIRRDSPLNELQPPPYQDEERSVRGSGARSGAGGRRSSSPEGSERRSSEVSVDQDTESYLNKGYEEDVPSDSTAVVGPEDGSGPQFPTAYEPEPLAKYGTLDVAFEYDSGEQWLAVTVTAATDIPALKQTGNISWQVHLVLLPTKKQRAKTGVQKGPCPVFTETFRFSRVEQDALGDYAVRFRLYSIRRMKKEKVLGEKVFYLTKLNLQGKMALPVTLEPGSALTGCGSLVSVARSVGAQSYRSTGESSGPEILLGLIYNSTTGRLSAEVIQGSHFKNTASDKPTSLFCCIKEFIGGQLYIMRDTYVKLTMLDSKGKEMSKCKTAVCRGQPNPTYKETFVFQVALFQLSEVSLVMSVFCRRSSLKPRERLGWVSLGLNSTGEDQHSHWTQMKEAEGQQVCRWHTLTDT